MRVPEDEIIAAHAARTRYVQSTSTSNNIVSIRHAGNVSKKDTENLKKNSHNASGRAVTINGQPSEKRIDKYNRVSSQIPIRSQTSTEQNDI